MSVFRYYLDTRQSLDPSNPADSQFRIPNIVTNESYTFSISLESAIIPNTAYPVSSGNNKIYFREANTPGVLRTATIPIGYYNSPSAFGQAIVTAMTAVGTAAYTYVYSSTLSHLFISKTPGASDYRFESGPESAYHLMGFPALNGSYSLVHASTAPVNLSGTSYVDVVCSFGAASVSSSGLSNVFARIPLTAAFGNMCYWQNTDITYSRTNLQDLQTIEIKLYDDYGRLMTLPKTAHCSFVYIVRSEMDL